MDLECRIRGKRVTLGRKEGYGQAENRKGEREEKRSATKPQALQDVKDGNMRKRVEL